MSLSQSLRAIAGQFGVSRDDNDYDDYYDEDDAGPEGDYRDHEARPLAVVRPPHVRFSLVAPADFDDAQGIADALRSGSPVILDLQACGPELHKRLIDFCSGLTYALEGSVQQLGEHVVLIAPEGVELDSDDPGGLAERRFLNQV
jgi:cell division inhibitor SepF